MILLDPRDGNKDGRQASIEMQGFIKRLGIPVERTQIEFGDACFEGRGPNGSVIMVGVERKSLSDMLNCIDDARYSAHQLPGMARMYARSILVVEGVWKPDMASGYLMECIQFLTWRPYRYRSQHVRYSKLFRYLLSIQLAGVVVVQSRDIEQTSFNIAEMYHYFQKKWEDHTSLLEVQSLNIPTLAGRPSLVQRWAAQLDGIGTKLSSEADKVFHSPIELARGDETDWLGIKGISVPTAVRIVKDINGW